ncbi:MAG: class I SAM-dependent methyltransferase [Butyrivibrio sp.]|nr:class I SAM-dependent methyltransferase [Butyrivibrio sp.]
MSKDLLNKKNHRYWIYRAGGYSEVNREELSGIQKDTWAELMDSEIRGHFGIEEYERKSLRVLDIGAGPGFLSIILARLGYRVTAGDFAETMLAEAVKNAGKTAEKIDFRIENAMDLSFANGTFDVVIARNLTWNLPEPELAYSEWLRVLKERGLMLVFDANWYAYLRDEKKRAAYDEDRKNVKGSGFGDYNIGENFDVMEHIADNMPLTGIRRPMWDEEFFSNRGVRSVTAREDIGSVLYSEKEKVNYASTPMFMVRVVK